MSDVLFRLKESIDLLESSVVAAKNTLASKYGAEHPCVLRLDSYGDAILGQRNFIVELQDALNNQNLDEVFRLTQLINGISHMIKEDARSLVESMYNGDNACDIDKDVLN